MVPNVSGADCCNVLSWSLFSESRQALASLYLKNTKKNKIGRLKPHKIKILRANVIYFIYFILFVLCKCLATFILRAFCDLRHVFVFFHAMLSCPDLP